MITYGELKTSGEVEMLSAIIDAYMAVHITGGSLHVVLDEGSFERGSIQYCVGYATERNDYVGLAIAMLMLKLPDEVLRDAEDFQLDSALLLYAGKLPLK